MNFQTAPVLHRLHFEFVTALAPLTESVVFMLTFQHLMNVSKSRQNIISSVVWSYQVNLAIEISNITEN